MQEEADQRADAYPKSLVGNEGEKNTPIDNTDNDGSEDPGSELDSIKEYNKKHDSQEKHPKPQADETLNPDLTTDNDI
jgi:hypothetical protein